MRYYVAGAVCEDKQVEVVVKQGVLLDHIA